MWCDLYPVDARSTAMSMAVLDEIDQPRLIEAFSHCVRLWNSNWKKLAVQSSQLIPLSFINGVIVYQCDNTCDWTITMAHAYKPATKHAAELTLWRTMVLFLIDSSLFCAGRRHDEPEVRSSYATASWATCTFGYRRRWAKVSQSTVIVRFKFLLFCERKAGWLLVTNEMW